MQIAQCTSLTTKIEKEGSSKKAKLANIKLFTSKSVNRTFKTKTCTLTKIT